MKRMYMNMDVNTVTFPFFAKLAEQKKITPDMLYPFIDVHRHTQVTDFVMNIFAQCSTASSDTQLDYEDIYEAALDGGAGTPFDKVQWWKGIYEIQKIHGIDIYEVWIDRCRQNGFRPWISVRMNDCHGSATKKPLNEKDFFAIAIHQYSTK